MRRLKQTTRCGIPRNKRERGSGPEAVPHHHRRLVPPHPLPPHRVTFPWPSFVLEVPGLVGGRRATAHRLRAVSEFGQWLPSDDHSSPCECRYDGDRWRHHRISDGRSGEPCPQRVPSFFPCNDDFKPKKKRRRIIGEEEQNRESSKDSEGSSLSGSDEDEIKMKEEEERSENNYRTNYSVFQDRGTSRLV